MSPLQRAAASSQTRAGGRTSPTGRRPVSDRGTQGACRRLRAARHGLPAAQTGLGPPGCAAVPRGRSRDRPGRGSALRGEEGWPELCSCPRKCPSPFTTGPLHSFLLNTIVVVIKILSNITKIETSNLCLHYITTKSNQKVQNQK